THPQMVVHGNVHDLHLWPRPGGGLRFVTLLDRLWYLLSGAGFHYVVVADTVDGLRLHTPLHVSEEVRETALRELKQHYAIKAPEQRLALDTLAERLRQVVTPGGGTGGEAPAALVLDYAGRLVTNPSNLLESEHAFFTPAEKLAHTPPPLGWADGPARLHPPIWVVDHERELPASFMAPSTPLRRIAVPVPQLEHRLTAARQLVAQLPEAGGLDETGRAGVARRFADATQGLPLTSMPAVVELTR